MTRRLLVLVRKRLRGLRLWKGSWMGGPLRLILTEGSDSTRGSCQLEAAEGLAAWEKGGSELDL